MKSAFLLLLCCMLSFSSCTTLRQVGSSIGAKDHRPLHSIPPRIDQLAQQARYNRDASYFHTQSVLYSELGARFHALKDYETARDFFDLSHKYDKRNRKTLFALALLDYEQGAYQRAIERLSMIAPSETQLFPYDIDYYEAARMILSQLPLEGRIIALSRNDWGGRTENIVVVNKGSIHGLRAGMEFNAFRIGNPIMDFETLETIGVQRTRIARVQILETDERNAICAIVETEPGYFIQINDIIQSTFGGRQ